MGGSRPRSQGADNARHVRRPRHSRDDNRRDPAEGPGVEAGVLPGTDRARLQGQGRLGPLFNKTSRPRDDDETVESLWSDWDIPRRMMQVALWIKEKNEETGEWESTFWKMLEESKCDDWSFQGHTI